MALDYLCIFLTLCSLGAGKHFRFDYDFHSDETGWFKVHLIPATWYEARLRCHLEGGVLASPLNENMEDAMLTLMSTKGVQCGVFTGLNSIFSKGDYISIEGVPIARINVKWAPGEPDNHSNNESCLVLLTNSSMSDVNCDGLHPYICYKKTAKDLVLTECGTIDHEYKRDSRTGSCYKFYNQPQTWSQAHMTCVADGGHLVIINSEAEAQAIKDIYNKNPEVPIIGNYQKDVVLIGLHSWNVTNNWVTVHGQTLQSAGYASWAKGQPDNWASCGGQACGGAFRATAQLADLCCNKLYPFICEKNPNSLLNDNVD